MEKLAKLLTECEIKPYVIQGNEIKESCRFSNGRLARFFVLQTKIPPAMQGGGQIFR